MPTENEILDALHGEWVEEGTNDARRAEIAHEVQKMAAGRSPTCVECHQTMVNLPYLYALIEGHVYSEAGVKEVEITRLCEWCFDIITAEPEEGEDG